MCSVLEIYTDFASVLCYTYLLADVWWQIPFFPLVKKDLTFIHFGNDSRVDGLVNFEKLRMIAKEVRQVTAMSRCDAASRSSTSVSLVLNGVVI